MPDKAETTHATRRAFLGAAALTAASYQRVLGANDRIGVGFIGFGLIGKQHVADFKKFNDVDIVGVCDVYKPRVEEALQYIGNPNAKGYSDFRKMYENKDIQGVVVATPDHWHALLTIMACAAGKDVYVEKPMTVFIDEGKWMIQAARKYNRIVVVGTQRRQGKGVAAAKKVIESGALGKIHSIRMASFRNIYPGFGKTPVSDPPPEIDYDMWLGPAPKKPYPTHRGLYHFRWFWDYSGGQMTNLGAHMIDQVLWFMNVKGPTLVMSTGGRFALEDDGETPDMQDASWVFPAFTMNCAIREANAMRGDPRAGLPGDQGSHDLGRRLRGDARNQDRSGQRHPAISRDTPSAVRSIPIVEADALDRAVDGRRGIRRPLRHRRRRHHGDERTRLAGLHAQPQAAAVRSGRRPPRVHCLQPGQHVPAARALDSLGPRQRSR